MGETRPVAKPANATDQVQSASYGTSSYSSYGNGGYGSGGYGSGGYGGGYGSVKKRDTTRATQLIEKISFLQSPAAAMA